MSIIIHGMDMPTEGNYSILKICPDGRVAVNLDFYAAKAEQIPSHGRLIDADALKAKFKEMGLGDNSLIERLFADGVYTVIDNAPTIIEAEEEE